MSATSQWSPANNVRCSVNGVVAFTDVDYEEAVGEFEATNLNSPVNGGGQLSYEGGVDVCTTSLRGNIVVDKTAIAGVKVGRLYNNFSWTDDLGESHAGSLRILTRGKKAAAKGAYTIAFTGKFTGLVTGQ
jgi:hypothetical protein